MTERTGVFVIGALGGVATTLALGARAIARGRAAPTGLTTASSSFAPLGLVALEDLVFGGCDVRTGTLEESALDIARANRSLDPELIRSLRADLAAIDAERVPGILVNAGAAIEKLASGGVYSLPLRSAIDRIRSELAAFGERNDLARIVVVNLASTEPPLPSNAQHATLEEFERLVDADRKDSVRSSSLYSYAAMREGCGYVNFTPSNAALLPALVELATHQRVPFCGSDGKTGETLVKAALAPMFRDRSLRVLSWQGYNILGDRDGEVLSEAGNLESKVRSKDRALQNILGYPLHTHVGIDFVPSLHDLKTAWDFIHFEGFLGHRMAMQFIWQGCDAILAAPLVLDLIRLVDFALRRGEHGALVHLASFFKSPFGCEEHDFHAQIRRLDEYVESHAATRG